MAYHHLALAVGDIEKTHAFYEGIMGFELVKVEVAPVMGGGWGKHFFYRLNGDDTKFIAFWEINDAPGQDSFEYNLNKAARLPDGTNHFSFNVDSTKELDAWRARWNEAGLDVLEIDHNWCHSVYTRDPDGNMVEFCLTTGSFTAEDRETALAMISEREFKASPPPSKFQPWPGTKPEAAE